MKLLIIGLGSAGQRHARVIRQLFPNAEIYAFVGEHRAGLIAPDLKSQDQNRNPFEYYRISEIGLLEIVKTQFDLAIIATPIKTHYQFFNTVIKNSKRVLIEKPISNSVITAESILDIAMKTNQPVLVGYQNNFNPLVSEILSHKFLTEANRRIQIVFHEYIREMNIFRDMGTHHLAQRDGGGVLLALSHELDFLLQFWSGELKDLSGEFFESEEFPGVKDRVDIRTQPPHALLKGDSISVSLSYGKGIKNRYGSIECGEEVVSWNFELGKISIQRPNVEKYENELKVTSDNLIALQLLYLLNKNTMDFDLVTKLKRAIEIVRLNEQLNNSSSLG